MIPTWKISNFQFPRKNLFSTQRQDENWKLTIKQFVFSFSTAFFFSNNKWTWRASSEGNSHENLKGIKCINFLKFPFFLYFMSSSTQRIRRIHSQNQHTVEVNKKKSLKAQEGLRKVLKKHFLWLFHEMTVEHGNCELREKWKPKNAISKFEVSRFFESSKR